jgi:hypothetical protein
MIVGVIWTAVYWLAQSGATWSAPSSVPAGGGVSGSAAVSSQMVGILLLAAVLAGRW